MKNELLSLEQLARLEAILYRENSVITAEDVEILMEVIREEFKATGAPTSDDRRPALPSGPPKFMRGGRRENPRAMLEAPRMQVYQSEVDDVWVVHVDTHPDGPENDKGPMLRIYVNDDGPVFANPDMPT
jgi:hypothetical protein